MEKTVIAALKYSSEQREKILRLCALIVSVSCLGTLAISVIVNFAVDSTLTWSLFLTISIVFAWMVTITALLKKKSRLFVTLLVASVLLIPYVYALERLTNATWFFALGLPIAVLVIVTMWVEYYIETKLTLRWPFITALEIFLNAVILIPVIVALSHNFVGIPLNLHFTIGPIIGAVLTAVFLAVGCSQKKVNRSN